MWHNFYDPLCITGYLTHENHMEINTTKNEEMILGPLARSNLPFLSTPTGTI